jgi:hypothetical protein
MKQKKKTYQVLAMQLKTPKINVRSNNLEMNRFDKADIEAFFKFILTSKPYYPDDRFVLLEKFDDNYDNNFYTGWFTSARHGEIGNWIDSQTLGRRPTGKKLTEGEENRTYFTIEKSTGLFLLQSDNKRIVTGNTVEKYLIAKKDEFEFYITEYNRLNQGNLVISKDAFIQLDYSISTQFMDEVRRLARIKKMTLQGYVKSSGGNNVIESIQNRMKGVEDYDLVEFSIQITEQRKGIKHVEHFLEHLQEEENYRNIIIGGTTQKGRPKIISWEKHARRYEIQVNVNNNGLPGQDDVLTQLIETAKKEQPLK